MFNNDLPSAARHRVPVRLPTRFSSTSLSSTFRNECLLSTYALLVYYARCKMRANKRTTDILFAFCSSTMLRRFSLQFTINQSQHVNNCFIKYLLYVALPRQSRNLNVYRIHHLRAYVDKFKY